MLTLLPLKHARCSPKHSGQGRADARQFQLPACLAAHSLLLGIHVLCSKDCRPWLGMQCRTSLQCSMPRSRWQCHKVCEAGTHGTPAHQPQLACPMMHCVLHARPMGMPAYAPASLETTCFASQSCATDKPSLLWHIRSLRQATDLPAGCLIAPCFSMQPTCSVKSWEAVLVIIFA